MTIKRTPIMLFMVLAWSLSYTQPCTPDRTPPVITGVPENIILDCGSELPPWPTSVSATDNCSSTTLRRVQHRAYSPCGSIHWERIWTATDASGNRSVAKQFIYFYESTAPMLIVPPDTVLASPAPVPEPTYEAYDACSEFKVKFKEEREDHNDCEFTLTRTWTARDGCGNQVTKTQIIEYIDTTPPKITPVNPDFIGIAIGEEVPVYTCYFHGIKMSDVNISEACSIVSSEAKDVMVANSVCERHGYYRKWKCSVTATDGAGNIGEYYFYVLEYDTTAPEIRNVPEDLALACGDSVPAVSQGVYVKDDCVLTRIPEFVEETVFDPADSSRFAVIRTWSSTDACGNYGEATQIITVCDFDLSLLDADTVVVVTPPDDINNLPSNRYDVFPNPVAEQVSVRLILDHAATVTLRLYDQIGRVIYTQDYELTAGAVEPVIRMGHLPAGIYLLQIESEREIKTHKLIKS